MLKLERGTNRLTGLIGCSFDMALFAHDRKLRGTDWAGLVIAGELGFEVLFFPCLHGRQDTSVGQIPEIPVRLSSGRVSEPSRRPARLADCSTRIEKETISRMRQSNRQTFEVSNLGSSY